MKPIFPALLALTIVGTAAPAFAVSPVIRGISPVGAQRGTEVTVTISGQRLTDARDLLFYQPGITVKEIKAGKDAEFTAVLKVAPNAELGLHDFRVVTATGISSLKTFSVGSLKELEEKEPNNDFLKPQKITKNVTINGVANTEDIDYYEIEAKKGERITVEVEGIRLGLTMFDPYVSILNSKRFELASSDDSALIWQDGFVSVIAPEDGKYIIAAREAAYAGNAQCLYRLHVGSFPRPTATIPAGGKIGEAVTVRWIGDLLGEKESKITLPASFDRHFGLYAQDQNGQAPYPNAFRLSKFGNTIEAEPNDAIAQGTAFTPPTALNGVVGKPGDVDFYKFKAKKDQTYDVRVFARQIRSPLDSVLTITTSTGSRVALNDDQGGPDSYVRFRAPRDGDYVVSIADHLKKGGPDYTYRIEISPVEPKLELSTPNESIRRGTGTMALAVPKGNRQVILINARRNDFGGAVGLSAANLPPGVKVDVDNITASNTVVPMLVTADAKAPLGATLAKISGKPLDVKYADIPSEFTSTAELVLGQNNIAFWTRTVEDLAVSVAEEAPFTMEIVEPKVPIVRGGTMELKVRVKRKPGFTAPIAIALPWNPPGISSKQDNVIAENDNEGKILLNANGGAELTTWRIVVNGTYTEPPPPSATPTKGQQAQRGRGFGRGRLTVASDFAKLSVASQFLTFRFNAASVEQGKDIDLAVKVNQLAAFPGEAKVTLVGLPNKAVTETKTITKDTTDLVFHIKTDPTTPPGDNKNLFCQVVVMQNGEPIMHNLGSGRLRVDAPLALKTPPGQKGAAPAKPGAKPAAATTAAASDPNKPPLSRLEKLRLESKERAAKAGTAAGTGAGTGAGGSD